MQLPSLTNFDPDLAQAICMELLRQQQQIELIASENIVSEAVLQAQGSILTNKYAEGYSGRRYYGGCEFVDIVEDLACERLKKLYGCKFANVQPHSGSQANQAVFFALLNPGDTFMGLKLDDGGHLTHGLHVNMSGKWFKPVSYGVRGDNHYIDHDQVYELARNHKPRLIIAGGSAYSRIIDFEFFRKVADEVGAYLMVDMAHFSGLVAGGVYPSPLPFADVVTSTTHKTLRGPRGGIILTNNDEIAKKVNSAVFPGLQGGPLMHVIAAKAVAFAEALQDDFKSYAKNVVTNAKVMEKVFSERGVNMVSGGTDSHLLLLDLRNYNVTGKDIAHALEQVNITCNKNGVPADHHPPTITSGIRIGTPAITTRGFGEKECEEVAHMIVDVIEAHQKGDFDGKMLTIQTKVAALCEKFPIYTNL